MTGQEVTVMSARKGWSKSFKPHDCCAVQIRYDLFRPVSRNYFQSGRSICNVCRKLCFQDFHFHSVVPTAK